MFAILKQLAENDVTIRGAGVLEVLSDGSGFLRAPESNYLPARMIFISRPVRCAVLACEQVIQ